MDDNIFWIDSKSKSNNIVNDIWFRLRVKDHKETFKNKLKNIEIIGDFNYPVEEELKIKVRKIIGTKREDLERILRKAKDLENLNKDTFNDPYLLNFYYWCTELKINVLSEIFNIDMTKDKNDIIKSGILCIDFICESCGKITCFYPNSRSNRDDYLLGAKSKHYQYSFCETCKEKHREREKKIQDRILLEKKVQEELNRLKTMPYKEYLQTEHWKNIRKKALYKAKYKCQLCSSKENLNVHHNTYENRGNEKDEDLIVLCETCHDNFHDKFTEED